MERVGVRGRERCPPSSSSHCLEFISRRNKSRQMWFDTKGEVESGSGRRELGFIAWDRTDLKYERFVRDKIPCDFFFFTALRHHSTLSRAEMFLFISWESKGGCRVRVVFSNSGIKSRKFVFLVHKTHEFGLLATGLWLLLLIINTIWFIDIYSVWIVSHIVCCLCRRHWNQTIWAQWTRVHTCWTLMLLSD